MECVNGQLVTAILSDYVPVEGAISIEDDRIYICQDKIDGNNCEEKHGFVYSWQIYSENIQNLEYWSAANIELFPIIL